MPAESRFTVRRATIDDLDTLVDMRMRFLSEFEQFTDERAALLRNNTRDYLSRAVPDASYRTWLADADSQAIGCGGVAIHTALPGRSNPDGRLGYVLNMLTLPQWRGRGVARTIVRAILDDARADGIRRLWLIATDAGRPVYEAAGFRPDARYMDVVVE